MEILTIILVGISLSMDSFSLSLCYGTFNLKPSKQLKLALMVGFFHFLMPLLGILLAHLVEMVVMVRINLIIFLLFLMLGGAMIYSVFKPVTKLFFLNLKGMILFALTVSMDSLLLGFGLNFISSKHLFSCIIFALFSFIFTYIGLQIGGKIRIKLGNLGPLGGGIVLIILGCFYLLKLY